MHGETAALVVSFLDYHNETSIVSDLSRYIRPVYFTADSVDNGKLWENTIYFEGVSCIEKYGHLDSYSLNAEFDSYGPWFCPNLTDYTLMGQTGNNLFMSV